MKVYGRSDTASITIPRPDGPHVHKPRLVDRRTGGQAAEIDCDDCAAYLLRTDAAGEGKVSGWAATPELAPKTEEEFAAEDAAQKSSLSSILQDPRGYAEYLDHRRSEQARTAYPVPLDLPAR